MKWLERTGSSISNMNLWGSLNRSLSCHCHRRSWLYSRRCSPISRHRSSNFSTWTRLSAPRNRRSLNWRIKVSTTRTKHRKQSIRRSSSISSESADESWEFLMTEWCQRRKSSTHSQWRLRTTRKWIKTENFSDQLKKIITWMKNFVSRD